MKIEPTEIPLGEGFYVSESKTIANKLCQNLFPNYPETNATSTAQLFTRVGLNQLDSTGDSAVGRAARVMAGVPYFVNGNTLWAFNRTIDILGNEVFTLNNLGTIPGEGRVSIADSGTQLVIVVPGTNTVYVYSIAAGLLPITDPQFMPLPATIVNSVVFASGIFVFSADKAIVFESNVNDALSYDSANFFIYGNARNNVVGLHEYNEQLYVFSVTNSAVYAPTNLNEIGALFTKVQGYDFTKGLSSQFAIYDFGSTFVMMGQGFNETPKIYMFTGNDFEPISTTSIEFFLESYTFDELINSFGFSYTFRGETFAIFSLKNNTFKYCLKASRISGKKIWAEDKSENLVNKSRWRVNQIVTVYDRLICNDSESGIIGELTEDALDDYGELIRYEFSVAPISGKVKNLTYYYLWMEIESGLATGDDELVVEMNYSDNAKVFPDTGWLSSECGLAGDYDRILTWDGLGQSETPRNFRFRMSKPGKYVITRLWVGVDGN